MKRLGENAHAPSNDFAAKMLQQTMNSLVSGQPTQKQLAEEELFELIESDRDLSAIMKENGADIERVKMIYEQLLLNGAGQWVKGAYVAAAAVATNPSLRHLLEQTNSTDNTDRNPWMRLSSEMVDFYSR